MLLLFSRQAQDRLEEAVENPVGCDNIEVYNDVLVHLQESRAPGAAELFQLLAGNVYLKVSAGNTCLECREHLS